MEWDLDFKPRREPPDGEPCDHRGCLSHLSHPCEGCGRIAGRSRWVLASAYCDRIPDHPFSRAKCGYSVEFIMLRATYDDDFVIRCRDCGVHLKDGWGLTIESATQKLPGG